MEKIKSKTQKVGCQLNYYIILVRAVPVVDGLFL
jgi:hypothetical protein